VAVAAAGVQHPGSAGTVASAGAGRSYEQLVDDGDRYQDEGRGSQARDRYRAALAMRPSGSEALAGLGLVDIEDGEFSSAVSNFRRSLASNPQYGEALVGLGRAYASQGSYQQAADAYGRYLQNNPSGQYAAMARRQLESLQERLHTSQGDSVTADAGASRN
jgi:tetratricopeptide (TPR) repeat protein